MPINEPGLQEMVCSNFSAGRPHFTNGVQATTPFGTAQFIAMGTPQGEDGRADVHYVMEAARNIGRCMNDYKVALMAAAFMTRSWCAAWELGIWP